jgi:hypothetical protein
MSERTTGIVVSLEVRVEATPATRRAVAESVERALRLHSSQHTDATVTTGRSRTSTSAPPSAPPSSSASRAGR